MFQIMIKHHVVASGHGHIKNSGHFSVQGSMGKKESKIRLTLISPSFPIIPQLKKKFRRFLYETTP
jgi:hypothetical protein